MSSWLLGSRNPGKPGLGVRIATVLLGRSLIVCFEPDMWVNSISCDVGLRVIGFERSMKRPRSFSGARKETIKPPNSSALWASDRMAHDLGESRVVDRPSISVSTRVLGVMMRRVLVSPQKFPN